MALNLEDLRRMTDDDLLLLELELEVTGEDEELCMLEEFMVIIDDERTQIQRDLDSVNKQCEADCRAKHIYASVDIRLPSGQVFSTVPIEIPEQPF